MPFIISVIRKTARTMVGDLLATKLLRAFCTSLNGRSHIADLCRKGSLANLTEDEVHNLSKQVLENHPDTMGSFLTSLGSGVERNLLDKICLWFCDDIFKNESPRDLLALGEFSASKLDPADFSILAKVGERSSQLLANFSQAEFVGLLSLVSRMDFVDSDFNQAVQEYLPSVISTFGDNHFPILFCSILRLGIDQPVDRVPLPPIDDLVPTVQQSSPLMVSLVDEMCKRISNISESGCLAILHSIVRRPKPKITKEMEDIVKAISERSNISDWGLAMRIQAIHTLSRLGVHDHALIDSLFRSIDKQSIRRIPSANLQHLLSIIHNHADKHPQDVWRPVIDMCIVRMNEPSVSRSMSMATTAVTLGYMGRLGVADMGVIESLLCSFSGIKSSLVKPNRGLSDQCWRKLIVRILTDSQTDIGHLASCLEALERLRGWSSPLAVPLAIVTRRLILRDGIHNVKAAPICLTTNVFLRNNFSLPDVQVSRLDALIDLCIDEVKSEDKLGPNWSLKSTTELVKADNMDWRQRTVLTFLEGLLKHEQYIRSTQSAIDRCLGLRDFIITDPKTAGIVWTDVAVNVRAFIDSLDPS
jgi:hypothetical protein